MRANPGAWLVAGGAALLIAAAGWWGHNLYEDARAGHNAELLLDEIVAAMPEDTDETVETDEMPVVLLEGLQYIGYLKIADLELTLPVLADWDYNRLKLAPCRHFGAAASDDLVIAAHNYKSHFGRLKKLSAGASVVFVDMDGLENRYAVASLQTLPEDSVEEVQNSGYDLVLYTCTADAKSRVVAFCDRLTD